MQDKLSRSTRIFIFELGAFKTVEKRSLFYFIIPQYCRILNVVKQSSDGNKENRQQADNFLMFNEIHRTNRNAGKT